MHMCANGCLVIKYFQCLLFFIKPNCPFIASRNPVFVTCLLKNKMINRYGYLNCSSSNKIHANHQKLKKNKCGNPIHLSHTAFKLFPFPEVTTTISSQ